MVATAILALWLQRDPRERFQLRTGTLAEVVLGPEAIADGHSERLVELRSSSGLRVEIALKRPLEHAPAGGRPLAVLLGGHETGRSALRFVGDTRGALVAALSYPYHGPRKPKGLAVVPAVPAIRGAILDTPSAISLALDWLLEEPDVDRTRVDLVGVSLGAPFAVIAGARDPRPTRVWSVHGGADVRGMLDANLKERLTFAPARWAVVGTAAVLANARWLEPERWVGSIAPRPFVMLNATLDERIPRACVEKLFEAACEPKELAWIEGGHVEPKRVEIVRDLVDRVLERVTEP